KLYFRSGGGCEGGMMISRRPNIRASTEKRPGPVPMMVTSIVIAKITAAFESNELGLDGGNKASATPAAPSAATTPANGVRKPTSSRPPVTRAARPRDHVANVEAGAPT